MKKTVKVFAAASIAVLLGSLFASCSSGLSIIEESAYENTRSVIVNDQIAVTSAIAKPFGLVADTSTENIIRLTWGSPSVPVDSWNIYLDGKLNALFRLVSITLLNNLNSCLDYY